MSGSGSSSNNNKYNPNTVIAAANEKLQAGGDLQGGQFIFQSALFEWVDDAREGGGGTNNDNHQNVVLSEAIATLWLAYAQFLVNAKQFKTATEVYQDAIQCPVAGHTGRIYAEYARFCMERNKRKTAQDVYMQALVGSKDGNRGAAVTDEQDRNLLWQEFLEMMKATQPDLTLESLQNAVQQETAIPEATASSSEEGPVAKRPRLESDTSAAGNTTLETSKTHVVTAESVQAAAEKLQALLFLQNENESSANNYGLLPPDVTAAWMIRDGNYPPVPPDPPLFSPSPPKLSDPTAKDILGLDLAVQLVERLLSPSGGIVLEVCRALWTLQALKEREATANLAALDATLTTDNEAMESELEARLSVVSSSSSSSLEEQGVRQYNDSVRSSFQANASQQRQRLLTNIAWDFRQLLCWQQQALAKLDVPGFVEEGGPTVDAAAIHLQSQICQYLHSAFYIRNRMGAEPHETMLRSQLKKLQREQRGEAGPAASRSPRGNTSPVPSPQVMRLSPIPPPQYNDSNMGTAAQATMMSIPNYNNPYPQQQQQQPVQLQPMMGSSNNAPPPYPPPPYGQQQQPMMMQQQQLPPQIMQGGGGGGMPPMMPPPPTSQQQPPLPPGSYPGQPQQQQQQPYQYYQR